MNDDKVIGRKLLGSVWSGLLGLGRKITLAVFHVSGMYPCWIDYAKRSPMCWRYVSGRYCSPLGDILSGPVALLGLNSLIACRIRALESHLGLGSAWTNVLSMSVGVCGILTEPGKCSCSRIFSESSILRVKEEPDWIAPMGRCCVR